MDPITALIESNEVSPPATFQQCLRKAYAGFESLLLEPADALLSHSLLENETILTKTPVPCEIMDNSVSKWMGERPMSRFDVMMCVFQTEETRFIGCEYIPVLLDGKVHIYILDGFRIFFGHLIMYAIPWNTFFSKEPRSERNAVKVASRWRTSKLRMCPPAHCVDVPWKASLRDMQVDVLRFASFLDGAVIPVADPRRRPRDTWECDLVPGVYMDDEGYLHKTAGREEEWRFEPKGVEGASVRGGKLIAYAGFGKTLMMISLCANGTWRRCMQYEVAERERPFPWSPLEPGMTTLVVTPPNLVQHWQSEIKKWWPGATAYVVNKRSDPSANPDFIIVSKVVFSKYANAYRALAVGPGDDFDELMKRFGPDVHVGATLLRTKFRRLVVDEENVKTYPDEHYPLLDVNATSVWSCTATPSTMKSDHWSAFSNYTYGWNKMYGHPNMQFANPRDRLIVVGHADLASHTPLYAEFDTCALESFSMPPLEIVMHRNETRYFNVPHAGIYSQSGEAVSKAVFERIMSREDNTLLDGPTAHMDEETDECGPVPDDHTRSRAPAAHISLSSRPEITHVTCEKCKVELVRDGKYVGRVEDAHKAMLFECGHFVCSRCSPRRGACTVCHRECDPRTCQFIVLRVLSATTTIEDGEHVREDELMRAYVVNESGPFPSKFRHICSWIASEMPDGDSAIWFTKTAETGNAVFNAMREDPSLEGVVIVDAAGASSVHQRGSRVETWKTFSSARKRKSVMIANERSCAVGNNWPQAKHVIFDHVPLGWSSFYQMCSRAHRFGQKDTVKAHTFSCRHSAHDFANYMLVKHKISVLQQDDSELKRQIADFRTSFDTS